MIICVDFDGVIHSYESGWQGADVISDEPVPGAFAWLEMLLANGLDVHIYSSRSSQWDGIKAMQNWFQNQGFKLTDYLKFPKEKPPAFLTIDDRCICFEGTFPNIDTIKNFKPWNKK